MAALPFSCHYRTWKSGRGATVGGGIFHISAALSFASTRK